MTGFELVLTLASGTYAIPVAWAAGRLRWEALGCWPAACTGAPLYVEVADGMTVSEPHDRSGTA
jgi:hypothetical protein